MIKIIQLFFCAILIVTQPTFAKTEQAIHPVPKEPKFIQKDRLPIFKKSLTLPPKKDSIEQKNDEKQLFAFQKSRTHVDCSRAVSEVYVSLSSFYGAPYGNLSNSEVETLTPFFEQIRNDADYYIQLLKKEFPRQRPFLYLKGLKPCVPKEVTGAYPSGHATLAKLYALILKDIFPAKGESLESRSEVIANDRILSGMHHPSDIEAGQQLGRELYKELKNSPEFQRELQSKIEKLRQ